MKLFNKTKHAYIAYGEVLEAGKVQDITNKKALEVFLKQPDVEKYASIDETEKLELENAELKAELEKVKAEKEETKTKAETPKKTSTRAKGKSRKRK